MAEQTKRKRWSDVKARLEALDRKGPVLLLGDLNDTSVANRGFLHSRPTPGSRAIGEDPRLVADAIYPDPFSKRRVSVRDAAAAGRGFSDAVDELVHALDARAARVRPGKADRR